MMFLPEHGDLSSAYPMASRMTGKIDGQCEIEEFLHGWDDLIRSARTIAMLPLEEWLVQFERADSFALSQEGVFARAEVCTEKEYVLRSIIRAAVPLKNAVLGTQPRLGKHLPS